MCQVLLRVRYYVYDDFIAAWLTRCETSTETREFKYLGDQFHAVDIVAAGCGRFGCAARVCSMAV